MIKCVRHKASHAGAIVIYMGQRGLQAKVKGKVTGQAVMTRLNLRNHYPSGCAPDVSHGHYTHLPSLTVLSELNSWNSFGIQALWPRKSPPTSTERARYVDDRQEEECARWCCRYSKSLSLADNPVKHDLITLFVAFLSHFVVRKSMLTLGTGSYYHCDHSSGRKICSCRIKM